MNVLYFNICCLLFIAIFKIKKKNNDNLFIFNVPFQHIKHVNPEILLAVPVPSPLLGNQLFNQVINVYQFRFSLSLSLSLSETYSGSVRV